MSSFFLAIYFALMLNKFFTSESFRLQLSNARNPLAEIRRYSPLPYLLIRDGTVYFAMYALHLCSWL